LDNKTDRFDDNPSPEIREAFLLYQKWLNSVLARLNNYFARYEAANKLMEPAQCNPEKLVEQTKRVTKDVLASVLGISLNQTPASGGVNDDGSLAIPEPWSDLLAIQRFGGTSCDDQELRFEVHSVADYIYLFHRGETGALPDWAKES